MTVLQQGLTASESNTMEVRLSALRATTAFVQSAAEEAAIMAKFKTLMPMMNDTLVASL